MVQVYSQNYQLRHYAPALSLACILKLVNQAGVVVLAFLAVYNTGVHWPQTISVVEQPLVSFTYDALLILEDQASLVTRVWSSSPEVLALLGKSAIPAHVQVVESDLNSDGLIDSISFEAYCFDVGHVVSAMLLLQFNYSLKGERSLKMFGLAYADYSSGTSGTELNLDGELRLRQTRAIPRSGLIQSQYGGLLNSSFMGSAVPDPSEILPWYFDQNLKTSYEFYPVWKAGISNDFVLTAKVRIPSVETIIIKLTDFDALKIVWPQVVLLYLVLRYCVSCLEKVIFGKFLVTTQVVSDLASPSMVP